VNVVDTAGLRHTDDPIEQEGVKDASLGWTEEDQQMLNLVQEEKTIVVGNKKLTSLVQKKKQVLKS